MRQKWLGSIYRVASGQGKSGKNIVFQGQGKVREFCKKSWKIFRYGKVMEKSGNFVMNARDTFLSQSYTFMLLILVPCIAPGGKILASFLSCVIFSPYKSFLKRKFVWWTQFIDLLRLRYDVLFWFTEKFSFALTVKQNHLLYFFKFG